MKWQDESERWLLELVRAGMDSRPPQLRESLTGEAGRKVYRRALQQAVTGVAYDGMTLLPPAQRPDRQLLLEWYGRTQLLEQENLRQRQMLAQLLKAYRTEGCEPVLLKGMGLGHYYSNPLRRQPGDIDLYFPEQYEAANRLAATWPGVTFHPETAYHRSFTWQGVEVEHHRIFVDFYHPRNRKEWAGLAERLQPDRGQLLELEEGIQVKMLSPQVNVLYVFLHLLHHFLQTGVGLRQVCDWVCLWRSVGAQVDRELFCMCLDRLRLRRAATALAYVAVTYLGLPATCIPLDISGKQAQRDGEKMLRDLLDGGNFGMPGGRLQGFVRNRHWKNLPCYGRALWRQARLYGFCPREVRAYPLMWVKSKIRKNA